MIRAKSEEKRGLVAIYILERESKTVYQYDIESKKVFKRMVNIPHNFAHNFAYCQNKEDKIFLVGGGDLNRKPATLKSCFQIIPNNSPQFDCIAMDELKYGRHGHSVCAVGNKYLVVTGSRCEDDKAYERCEQYNIDMDLWFDLPSLNIGRHYHSSCSFNESIVYVFCGIAQSGRRYCNSIEFFNVQVRSAAWSVTQIGSHLFPERQGAGVSQINNDEIVIFGGFNGKYCRDASIFNTRTNKMRKAATTLDFDLFAFQMPTVYIQNNEILTADWQTKRMISYTCDQRFKFIKDLRQYEQ